MLVPLVLAAAGLAVLPEPCQLPRQSVPTAGERKVLSRPLRRAATVGLGVLAVGLLLGLWPWWLAIVAAAGSGMPVHARSIPALAYCSGGRLFG